MHDAPPISTPVLAFFRHITRGYFRRHFRAVRVSHPERLHALTSGPLIVYANHSSWWDPMVQTLLAAHLSRTRRHYAPMDADALARYGILRRIGVFPVEMQSARGAAKFIRTGLSILAGDGVLWITPQGRFADARERPLNLKPGLAALAAKVRGGCTVLPLAIEYPFWDERLPETLLHFGEPVTINEDATADVQQRLESALLAAMQTLAEKTIARDPAAFTLLARGRTGTGGFYEFGQRLSALLRRRPYQPEHTAHPGTQPPSAFALEEPGR